MIKEYGIFVINVFGDPDEHLFHYTIGQHEAGLPELLAIGGGYGNARAISGCLTDLAKIMRERKQPFAEGELVSLGGKYPVKVINLNTADVCDHYTCQVEGYYGTQDYSVQQMLIPDPEGRFPGDPGCAEPYASYRVPPAYPGESVLNSNN